MRRGSARKRGSFDSWQVPAGAPEAEARPGLGVGPDSVLLFNYYSVLLCTSLYYSALLCTLFYSALVLYSCFSTVYYSALLLYYSVLLCTTLFYFLERPQKFIIFWNSLKFGYG